MSRRITALAAGAVLAAALAAAGATAARATTGTCTSIATPVSAPIGCGGVYLPLLGSGIQPDASSLTLTAASDTWNAQVTVTPYGRHLGGTINSTGNLCLSVEAVRDGPRTWWGGLAIRWHAVERTCNTFGAHFTAGAPDGGAGVPGVVNLANRFQTWSPIPAAGGYVLANNALSGNAFNHPLVLDARGGRGPQVLAFPENDRANEIWKVIGCTNPVTALTPGFFSCP